jgi:hypothetical protein
MSNNKTVTLEAMVRRASKEAEKMFNKCGGIEMYWLVDTAENGQTVIVTPWPADMPPAGSRGAVKDARAECIRELFKEMNVTRYVLVHEAWVVARSKDTSPEDMRDDIAEAGGSLANMPERLEFVVLQASDGHDFIHAMREIVRPAGGKPYLGALDVERPINHAGRYENMLPIENATLH